MVALLAHALGSIVGGLLVTAFIGWLLGKLSDADPVQRYFFAFILCGLLGTLGQSGDGAPAIFLVASWAAYAVAAAINCALAMRRTRLAEDVETFE